MSDIKQQIREACIIYCEQANSVYNEKDIFEAGANFVLSKWQEATRWRKVEEETPEIIPEEPYFINVKTDDNNIETLYIEQGTNCIDKLYRHFKDWHPINP